MKAIARTGEVLIWLALFCWASLGEVRADQVQMVNGDRYQGKVLAMTNDTVIVQSEVLGSVKFPRSKVASITFGSTVAPEQPSPATATASARPRTNAVLRVTGTAPTNSVTDVAAAFRQQPNSSSLLEQVRSQYLSEAGPEAQAKFNELMGGLMTGKLTVNDIRKEAKSAADQIRSLKSRLGDQAS